MRGGSGQVLLRPYVDRLSYLVKEGLTMTQTAMLLLSVICATAEAQESEPPQLLIPPLSDVKYLDGLMASRPGAIAVEFVRETSGNVDSTVPGEMIEHLRPLGTLRRLSVAKTDKRGFQAILRLEQVTDLALGFPIGDKDLAALRKLPKLERLRLINAAVSPKGLSILAKFPKLESLSLHHCPALTDSGLVYLSKCQNLKELSLEASGDEIMWGSAGWHALAHLKQLEQLEVKTPITDIDVQDLGSLRRLKVLTADRSKLSEDGKEKLKRLLPRVQHKVPEVW